MDRLPKEAKIVIVGGGVMGLFTAWELGRRGERDVVILERRSFLGAGATQKSAGGVRSQFTTAPNVRLSRYSQNFYRTRFAKEINPDFVYRQNGYLFFARSREKLDALDRALTLQKAQGVEAVRRIQPEEILQYVPDLRIDDVLGANYSPEDGYVDPGDIVNGLDANVRKMGVRIFLDTEVERVEREGGRYGVVLMGEGLIKAEKVLFATGAWSRELVRRSGYDVPIEPYRRNIYVTEPIPWFPKNAPFTFDILTGTHFKPESSGILFLKINPDEGPSFNEEPDMDWLENVIPDLIHVMPRLENVGIADAWAGLYDMSPDHSAILGPIPGVAGLYVSIGFSGHGLMHAPGVGISMAEYLLDGKTSTLDVSEYRPERFGEGRLIEEAAVY
jgi:sarcosine oxidase subunit beta